MHNNNNNANLAITIAWLCLQNRQAKLTWSKTTKSFYILYTWEHIKDNRLINFFQTEIDNIRHSKCQLQQLVDYIHVSCTKTSVQVNICPHPHLFLHNLIFYINVHFLIVISLLTLDLQYICAWNHSHSIFGTVLYHFRDTKMRTWSWSVNNIEPG